MLVLQLKTLGILSFMSIEELPELDFMLKNVWADNADFMSKQYTGTGALKTDYTRTGKRSVKGTMTDGVNSAKRFVNKQFKDDYKQMSMDLFLGRFLVQRRAYDPSLSPALSNMQHVMTSTSPESNNTAAQQPTLAKADRELQFSALILLSAEDPSDPYEARSGERHPAILELCPAKNSPRGLDNTNPFLTEVEGSSDGEIVSYVIPLRSTKQFAFSSLRQVIIHPRFHRLVGLLFSASARPYYYIFSSVKERAQFIQSIQCYIPDLPQFPGTSADLLPSLSPSPQEAQWAEKLGVFVGTWDLADQGPSLNLSWIGKGHNLYVIAVQNCFYQPPQEVVSSCRAHWIYVLQAYLGPQYSLLVSTTNPTEGTALVVLARSTSYTKVTNLKVQNVEERRAPKDFFGISNTASAPTQGEKKTVKDRISPFVNKFAKRLESSFATQAANFSLGIPEAAPDSPVSRSTEGRTIGDCISFFFNGTSFCFINSKRGTAPKLPAATKMDLFSDFDHVFWMGCDINSSTNNNSKSSSWTELVAQPPQGSILWRSLPDCNLTKLQPLTHSNVVVDQQQQNPFQAQTTSTPSSASSSSEKHYPLSASFSVTTRHICGQLDHNLGLSLVFYDLKGHNFAASDIGKGEYCILFEAPFFEEGFRTSYQNVSSLSWQDNVELPILFPQQGYIRRHSVRLTVVDRGSLSSDGTTIGVCIVSLRKLSLLSQQSFEFREAVVYNDQTCGWISGTICATKRDISAQKGNLHRSSASSPSSSDSQQHNPRFRPYSMQLPPVTTTTGGSGSPSATSPRKHPAAARAQSLPHFHASNTSLLDSPSPDFMTYPSSSSSSFTSPSSPFPLSSSSGYPSYQPQFQHQDYSVPPSSYFASSQPSSSQFYSSGSTMSPPSPSSPYTSSSSSSPYFSGSAPSSPFSSQQQQQTLQPVPYSPQPPPLAFTLPPSFSQQFPQQ
ncbi:Phosphoinositide phosphatase sac1 [Balamuthia mandrillaris]